MEYIPVKEGNPILLKIVEGTNGSIVTRLNTIFHDSSILGEAIREFLCRYFLFAANNIPETCTDLETLDKAIKWGCGHALGPFETWDAVGVRAAVEIIKNYNWEIPAIIEEMLSNGHETFYKRAANGLLRYDLERKEYVSAAGIPEEIDILSVRKKSIIVRKNQTASLNDVGEGIAYLEFNSNTLNYDTLQFVMECCDEVEQNFVGMLLGSRGVNLSAGINVGTIITGIYNMDWNSIEELIIKFQNTNMRLKYLEKPVVAMPAGLTVMGGCELAMHSAACQSRAEAMMGFQETQIGLIPLGGGCKEQMVRLTEFLPDGVLERGMNIQQLYLKVLENLTSSKVSSSAAEAVELGYLRRNDPISLNPDRQFWEAKQLVLGLAKYYRPPQPSMIPVMGESFRGLVESNLLNLRMGRFVTEYDSQIASKIACVISGGECPSGTIIKEEEILALEREAILSLCGEGNTQERLIHFLKTGKPLRN